jgi:hypothetical protein
MLKGTIVLACGSGSTRALSVCYVRLGDKRVTEWAPRRNLNLLTSSSLLDVVATALCSAHQNKLARYAGLVAAGHSGCVLTGCLHHNQLFTCKFPHHVPSRFRRWKLLWCDFRLPASNVYHIWGRSTSLTLTVQVTTGRVKLHFA